MAPKNDTEPVTVVEQTVYPVPDIPIKELLDAIPYVSPPPFNNVNWPLTYSLVRTASSAPL